MGHRRGGASERLALPGTGCGFTLVLWAPWAWMGLLSVSALSRPSLDGGLHLVGGAACLKPTKEGATWLLGKRAEDSPRWGWVVAGSSSHPGPDPGLDAVSCLTALGCWTLRSVGLWVDKGALSGGCWLLAPKTESLMATELEPQASVPENCQVVPKGFRKAQGRTEAARRGLVHQTSQKGGWAGHYLVWREEAEARTVVDLLTKRAEECTRSSQGKRGRSQE